MKCGGPMQVGFILESTESGRQVSKWIEGMPEFPWNNFGVKIKNKEQHPIQTYRCAKCGYLESYAGTE
jgi:hypothetical protein